MNKMQEVKLEKITLNIGVGGPGEKLDKAMKLLKNMSGAKPVPTKTNKRIPTWEIRPGLQIGCKVTLRGKKAEELLKRLLEAKDKSLDPNKFDRSGNLSFGISEYLDIPEVEYDMEVGIIGLEVAVTFEKPGYRIKRRRIFRKKIHQKHTIKKEETIKYITEKYGVKVGKEE